MSTFDMPMSDSVTSTSHVVEQLADQLIDQLRAAGCVFAEEEARLLLDAAPDVPSLESMTRRRLDGEPLEHVIGWTWFRELRIEVDPGVFVPRRRTEFLADQAIALASGAEGTGPPLVVVDLCCGSGAVGVAIVTELERSGRSAQLHAVDVDPAAVACACRNVGDRGEVHLGDLYAPLPAALAGRVDLLVANAPYVPTEAIALMPPEARLYEPRNALDGGADGLAVLTRVIADAPTWLAPGGHLLVETSRGQVPRVAELVVDAGLDLRVVTSDELDATVVTGSTSPS